MTRHRSCRGGVAAALLAAMVGAAPAQPARLPLVQPSADHVPANLLRISLAFSGPVEAGMLSRLALVHADGSLIAAPFLPEELWSPDGTVLTLLLHPGRVKTGLYARATLGPILTTGETVALTLDGRVVHRWQVAETDTDGPHVASWRIAPLLAGARRPLVVTLDGPVDGRAVDHIGIADVNGHRVAGKAVLSGGESQWTFTPAQPWRPGRYRLMVRSTLEDAAGNRVNGRFETAPDAAPEPVADQIRYFTVKAPAGKQGR